MVSGSMFSQPPFYAIFCSHQDFVANLKEAGWKRSLEPLNSL
jgi:hypothetical protein